MEYNSFAIEGLLEIKLPTFTDGRGFFREVMHIDAVESLIQKSFIVKQMNHSRSIKSTLRGIHVAPWNKLIYVTAGTVQSIIVDVRKDSETFGQYQSFEIGEDNKSALFVPAGCGNSYLVLSDDADYTYLTDEDWTPNKEIGIMWNDPSLNIQWLLKEDALLSEKDKNNLLLTDFTARELFK